MKELKELTAEERRKLDRAQMIAWLVFAGMGVGYFLVTLTLSLS